MTWIEWKWVLSRMGWLLLGFGLAVFLVHIEILRP